MKLLRGILAAAWLLAGIGATQAAVRIANDWGGRIGSYLDGYQELGASGQTVAIDGLCASACTIVLAMDPAPQNMRDFQGQPGLPRCLGFRRTPTDHEL
jgi:hypothetical protein